jgi:nucleotide-binding universal stress UspA family protein
MYPFKNILFPTDFSTNARAALKYAAAFARQNGGRVVLFSVQSGTVPPNFVTLPERAFDDPDHEWLKRLQRDVKDHMADPMLDGLIVEPVIIDGEPAPEIAEASNQFGIDLITIVTAGRKGISRALWGSMAEEIIAEAPCPVLTIRPPQRDFVEHRGSHTEIRLNRVLLATDFRPHAKGATRVAAAMAKKYDAELHVIYVISDVINQMADIFPYSDAGAGAERLRRYATERMAEISIDAGVPTVTQIAEGRPYEEIVRLATENDSDLIVMGTGAKHTSLGGAPVVGAELERVIRNAPCPVLSVPSVP